MFDAAGVFVERPTYVPGQTTSWHAHTGVHVVAVLSGALTVYDESCQARTYGAGETYVGGTSAHLARNEDHAPVEMVVTYLSAAGTTLDQFTVPRHAPLNCETQESGWPPSMSTLLPPTIRNVQTGENNEQH